MRMSRYYEMSVEVKDYGENKEDVIEKAVEDEWNIEDAFTGSGDYLLFSGRGNLVGDSEDEFAQRVRDAVWRANGVYCPVEVRCIYLEDPPCEIYSFDEEDYAAWKK
jgi:hypothetical protein